MKPDRSLHRTQGSYGQLQVCGWVSERSPSRVLIFTEGMALPQD